MATTSILEVWANSQHLWNYRSLNFGEDAEPKIQLSLWILV